MMPVKKPTPVKRVAGGKRTIGLTSAIGAKATTMVVICVLAGGMMVAARQQQAKAKLDAAADVRAEMTPVPASRRAPAKTPVAASAAPAATPAVAPATTPAPKTARATVTGCLEDDGPTFKLTETTGAHAPKARSWKSGFLKKGAASVRLVGSSNALNLASHVGRRVSVTGTLANREMQAHSVHRVAGTCKAN